MINPTQRLGGGSGLGGCTGAWWSERSGQGDRAQRESAWRRVPRPSPALIRGDGPLVPPCRAVEGISVTSMTHLMGDRDND